MFKFRKVTIENMRESIENFSAYATVFLTKIIVAIKLCRLIILVLFFPVF